MAHPFFSELNETLICEHKTNSWNTDDTTPYHCHDGYEILVFIGGHASFFVENDGKILEPGDIVSAARQVRFTAPCLFRIEHMTAF